MRIDEVKRYIRDRIPVTLTGGDVPYIVTACIMRLRDGEWRYSLELSDARKSASSVTIVDMETYEPIPPESVSQK